jgi:hypothetical protein
MQHISIKIAHQAQANQPVLLHSDGSLSCGPFRYQGRSKKQFKQFYCEIRSLANTKPVKGILDVSQCETWDAISIHERIMVENWQRTISAGRIRRLAEATLIRQTIDQIKPEFKRSASAKWKKLFRSSRTGKSSILKHAWELFLPQPLTVAKRSH